MFSQGNFQAGKAILSFDEIGILAEVKPAGFP
jgi:hypothetical protein